MKPQNKGEFYLRLGAVCDFSHTVKVLEGICPHLWGKEALQYLCSFIMLQYLVTMRECCHSNRTLTLYFIPKFQIELTLEQHRRVTDMDPVHSGKSLSNKQCSPSYLWPCIHGSSQLRIVDRVALWYLLKKFCVKVHPQSLNLLCSRVTCSFIHLQQKRDKHYARHTLST